MGALLPKLPDMLVFLLVYAAFLCRRWQRCGSRILAVNTLLYGYLMGLACLTLSPILLSLPLLLRHSYAPMNLVPFVDVLLRRGDYVRQILLNVLLTVPFGVLLPLCRWEYGKRCGVLRCGLVTLGLSAGIELLQPLLNASRSSDITDIITNTVGGVLGFLLFRLLLLLFRSKRKD